MPKTPSENKHEIAKQMGVGAVIFSDLSAIGLRMCLSPGMKFSTLTEKPAPMYSTPMPEPAACLKSRRTVLMQKN